MRRALLPALIVSLGSPAAAYAGNWTVIPAGYVQHDYGHYSLEDDSGTENAPRRTRLGLKADHASGLKLRLEWDFIGGTVTDAYAELPVGRTQWRLGQFKQPFSLEEPGSARDTVLIERSQVHDAFSIPRRTGVMWITPVRSATLQLSAFAGTAEEPSAARGLAARAFFHPGGRTNLHLGLAVAHEQREDDLLRLRARPESRLLPFTAADTGRRIEPDSIRRIGIESVWLKGPLAVQGEIASLRGEGSNSLAGEGAYVQASWLTGGAARSLKDGAVRGPKLDGGGYPLEFSARVSRVEFDLGSQPLISQNLYSLGASAFLGTHVRVSLEQTWIGAERSSALSRAGDFDGAVTTARLQLSF